MKKLIIIFLSLASVGIMAQEIKGTLILKGSLKTKILVNGVKTVCKLKVEKVQNLKEEDQYGNPGYKALIELSLDGNDFERSMRVKMDKSAELTNMFSENGKLVVKDLSYFSSADKIDMTIDMEGRLKQVSFPFNNQIIQCNF